jgi:hypothetical protein
MKINYIEKFLKLRHSKVIITIAILIAATIIGYFIVVFQIQQQQKVYLINLQNRCNAQSKIFFDNLQEANKNMQYSYKNFYHINLNKCYILIHGIGVAKTGISDKLIDVYENSNIADCESYTTASSLNSCVYKGSIGLYNMDNFNNFISPYIGNN